MPETAGFEIGAGDTYIINEPESETLDLFIHGERATPAQFLAYVTKLRDDLTAAEAERDALRNGGLAWLGRWRDSLSPEAVSTLQDVLGVPKEPTK